MASSSDSSSSVGGSGGGGGDSGGDGGSGTALDGVAQFDQLSAKLFQKTKKYLQAELSSTIDSYTVLETMNDLTAKKYAGFREKAECISASLERANELHASLAGHFEKIDRLDESIGKLEEMAYTIDGYTKRLEKKFKEYSTTSSASAGSSSGAGSGGASGTSGATPVS